MRLHTTTWGEGDRLALLIHGIMADHRTWRRVGPALAERGYRVLAVDLRGHGVSGRASSYTARDHARDVVETLPAGAELAMGHSLGGLVLSLAVRELAPARAVYVDPAWRLAQGPDGFRPERFTRAKQLTRAMVRSVNPRWTDEDLDAEMAALELWDESTAYGLAELTGRDLLPAAPVVPSLVPLADPSTLVPAERAALLRGRGFEVRTVAGTGHCVHRDDFDGFMASLEGWIHPGPGGGTGSPGPADTAGAIDAAGPADPVGPMG